MDQGEVCESLIGREVDVLTDEFPFACGGEAVDTGKALAADRATKEIQIDDGVLAIVGELWEGEAEDEVFVA